MSYYKPSYSQTVAMSRGGRGGYSTTRGSSYRGNTRGSTWTDRGSRGGYMSTRGGRSSYSSSFDSRPRYSTGDKYSGSRHEDNSYKRPYRSESSGGYSSRDVSSHRSPERKRMRHEAAASSRRSHVEGVGYGGASAGGSSAESYGRYAPPHASYTDRRIGFDDDRRASFRPREDYRRPAGQMGGPSAGFRSGPPRAPFRGRLGTRGSRGAGRLMATTSRDVLPRRRLPDRSYAIRKRGGGPVGHAPHSGSLRTTSDYARRIKAMRVRSLPSRGIKKSKSEEKDDSDKDEENWDDELEKKDADAKSIDEKLDMDEDDDDMEEEASGGGDKPAKKDKSADSEKEDEEDEAKKHSDSEDEAGGDSGSNQLQGQAVRRKKYRFLCPHCGAKYVTQKEYSTHLYSARHISSMRKISLKQKNRLARMRMTQRTAQRELEKNDDELSPRTNFCAICKLNYKQLKTKHQMSEAHREMKKFLMPFCWVCDLTFASPMLYENHLCSLDHLRRKAEQDLLNGEIEKAASSGNEDDNNLDTYMTLDSVGEVDDEEQKELPKPKPKKVNVGAEHIKKIEVQYCRLCRSYLPRSSDKEETIREHCTERRHLQRYLRYKQDSELRKRAEKVHQKSQERKESHDKGAEADQKPAPEHNSAETTHEDGSKKDAAEKRKKKKEDEDAADEKLWEDDKDFKDLENLQDLLEDDEHTGNKTSDDEEELGLDGRRYDRFRNSEKSEENVNGAAEEGKTDSAALPKEEDGIKDNI